MTNVFVLREYDSHADLILRNSPKAEDEGRVRVDFDELEKCVSSVERDLAYVAAGLFECEELQNNDRKITFDPNSWARFLVSSSPAWGKRQVADTLAQIFSFATRTSIRPRFERLLPMNDSKAISAIRSVSLFSGGVDSLCGILSLPDELKPNAAIFVSHSMMRGVVDNLKPALPQTKIYSVSIQQNMTEIQQLRGFLYMCFGGILACLGGANSIVISETGPTMYQPQYLPTDLVTVTTSPFLVEMSKRLIEQVLDCKLQIYEPFENMTKAEAMAICPQKSLIRQTNSCITSRFSRDEFPQCGRCLGCVIRRLSGLVANVEDSGYAWDVALMGVGEEIEAIRTPSQKRITDHDMDNLLMLLRFARGTMRDKLPSYTASIIHEYKKEELFKRFALDILAAVHLLSKDTRNSYLKKFYLEMLRDGIVTRERLLERVGQVRDKKIKPDFTPAHRFDS